MNRGIDLRIERDVAASPERLWQCLKRRELLAEWFFAVDFEPIPGHRFTILGDAVPGWRGWTNVEVIELDPPRRMVWAFDCTSEAPPSRVTFSIEPIESGCRLVITHEGEAPGLTCRLLKAGWTDYSKRLAALAPLVPGQFAP